MRHEEHPCKYVATTGGYYGFTEKGIIGRTALLGVVIFGESWFCTSIDGSCWRRAKCVDKN
jgi:hypothetical protein